LPALGVVQRDHSLEAFHQLGFLGAYGPLRTLVAISNEFRFAPTADVSEGLCVTTLQWVIIALEKPFGQPLESLTDGGISDRMAACRATRW